MTDGTDTHGILEFWSLALRLKQLRRQGWLDRGVTDPESAADHSWGVALLAWLLARDDPDLARDRILLLGLVHDLPEAVAGDATPFDAARDPSGVVDAAHFLQPPSWSDAARQAKQLAESAALEQILDPLPAELAAAIRAAWHEYESQATPEARFVRQVDKLETLLQAEDYAARQPQLVVDSFRLGTRRDVSDPRLVRLIAALRPESPADPAVGHPPR